MGNEWLTAICWRSVLGSGSVELGELDSVRAKHRERGCL